MPTTCPAAELAARGASSSRRRTLAWRSHIETSRPADGDRASPGLALRAISTPGHTPDHLAISCARTIGQRHCSVGFLDGRTVGRTEPARSPSRARTSPVSSTARCATRSLPCPTTWLCTRRSVPARSAPARRGGTDHDYRSGTRDQPNARGKGRGQLVQRLLAGLGSFPAYFSRLPEVNRRGPRLYGTLPALEPQSASRELRDLIAQGSVLVDVRPIEDFAAGHIPGALSIELRPVFASWLGWLVEPDRPLNFVLGDDQDRSDLVRQCLSVGYEHLAGELDGGMTAWRVGRAPRIDDHDRRSRCNRSQGGRRSPAQRVCRRSRARALHIEARPRW